MAILRPFIIALQFLTRLPTPSLRDIQEREFGASMVYYPWVGLLLGIIFALTILFATKFLPHSVSAVILLILWVFVTGGLHLDGLADSADAWVGGYGDREKTLRIMKDPACGPIAVAVVVLTLLLKYSALLELISAGALTAIIAAPIVARASTLLLFLTTDYVRVAGLGSAIKKYLPQRTAYLHLALSFSLVLYLTWGKGITLLLIVLIIYYGLRRLMINRLGGTTGDTAGAMIEIIEAVSLVALTFG